MGFNLFDFSWMFILIGLAMYGVHQGVLRFAVKFAGMIIMIVLLAMFSARITEFAVGFDSISPRFAVPGAFFIVFTIGMLITHLLSEALHGLVHLTPAGFIDSSLGAVVGVLKAVIVGGVIALMLSFAPEDSMPRKQYETSQTAHKLHRFLMETVPLVKKAVLPLYQKLRHEIPEQGPGGPLKYDKPEYI